MAEKIFSEEFAFNALKSFGACLFIFLGKLKYKAQMILSTPTLDVSGLSYLLAKSISRNVLKMLSKSTLPSPIAVC